MKVMKFNESLINDEDPQIGDYVICEDGSTVYGISEFVSNNIGRIVDYNYEKDDNYPYKIEYNDIPLRIKPLFSDSSVYPNTRGFRRDEIKYFSKNIKDLEIYLTANKYNL